MFRLMILSAVIVGVVYISYRLILPMRLRRNVTIFLLTGLISVGALFPLFLEVQHNSQDWVVILGIVSSIAVGLISFLFSYTLIKDLFVGAFKIVGAPIRRVEIIRALSLVVVVVSVLSTAIGYVQATTPRIKEITILTEQDIDEFTIVQLSDLHLTKQRPKEWLNNIVEMVNGVNADLIVITGDVADIELPDNDNLLGALANLHSKNGVFGIFGNHEYYYGRQLDNWAVLFDDLGIKLLQNENAIINHKQSNIMIAGITDNEATRFGFAPPDIPTALKSDSVAQYKILLAHQPQNVEQASKYGVDLQLSGHTHGGQFFPWNIMVSYGQKYFKGLYSVGGTTLYVNQGTGFWAIPMRLGSYSEITVITIKTTYNYDANKNNV